MTAEEKLQRVRIRGICCCADGEVRPFDCDLTTILRAIEAAAVVGLKVRLDEDHVKLLQKYLVARGCPGIEHAYAGNGS